MALQSKLFRGDAKLEAALISDSAHIVQGAAGAHVGKIQQALNELDGAGLKPDEKYGPATASAVLAYKQKRNIINHSYQTRAISALPASGLIKEVFNFDGPFLVAEPKVLTTSPGAVSKVFTPDGSIFSRITSSSLRRRSTKPHQGTSCTSALDG